MERARYNEQDFLHQSRRSELQRQLEDERMTYSEAILRLREEGEQAKRALQVSMCCCVENSCAIYN